MSELKLTIELVPQPLWNRSLYRFLPRKEWKKLREKVLAQYNYHCGICGAGGVMICHEIWSYDDTNYIQRLTGLIALCTMCNDCKHMGIAGRLAARGLLDIVAVADHFCRVNNISYEEFMPIRSAAFEQWRERSKHEWEQDFGEYAGLIGNG